MKRGGGGKHSARGGLIACSEAVLTDYSIPNNGKVSKKHRTKDSEQMRLITYKFLHISAYVPNSQIKVVLFN